MSKLEPRARKVKILATVGPASRDPEMLRRLFRAGVDAFRVNMSHGAHEDHAAAIACIREMEKEFARPIAILADLQGPKLRVGAFRGGKAVLRHSSHFTFDASPEPGDESRVCLPHPELFGILDKGQRLLVDDGKIRLRVSRAGPDEILCSVEVGGMISDRKGVNVPDAEIPIPALTDKDRRDLAFAIAHGADWIGLSFVQRPEDLAEARRLMGGHGALTISLRNPGRFRSTSAFAPIVAPSQVPWGHKALDGYLGTDQAAWQEYDACALIDGGARLPDLLVDQGDADNFLTEQLKTHLLEEACTRAGQKATIRMQPGYDHSYYFISTFMAEHLAWHADRLK